MLVDNLKLKWYLLVIGFPIIKKRAEEGGSSQSSYQLQSSHSVIMIEFFSKRWEMKGEPHLQGYLSGQGEVDDVARFSPDLQNNFQRTLNHREFELSICERLMAFENFTS